VSAAPFAYARPASLAEAAELLTRPGARALAGGQSLVPLLVRRALRVEVLVDLLSLPGGDQIRVEGEELRIGALARQRAVERSSAVARACPLLQEGVTHVGHPATRNRGTIGGSLAHADPAAELPTIAIALGAHAVVRSAAGETRSYPLAGLLLGPQRTALKAGELILELRLPVVRAREGHAWMEFAPRFADLPIVGVGAAVELDGEARVAGVRAAIGGVGPTPVDCSGALTRLLRDRAAASEAFESAARDVGAALTPEGDSRGSAALRRRLAITLLSRALVRATDRVAA
jgi:aerobic carbon-monoxide dehydrogenase medium subunit